MDYERIISSLVDELRSHPSIEILKEELSFNLDKKYIGNLFRNAGIKADEQVIDYFSTIITVDIEWQSKALQTTTGVEETVFGKINLLPIEIALDGYGGGQWDFIHGQIQERDRPDRICPIDYYNSDSQECACLIVRENSIEDHLYLYSLEDGLVDLNLTIDEYVTQLSRSKGIFMWQKAILYPSSLFAQQFHRQLKLLF